MKKVLVLLAMVLGATNMYAQDYDLQGLAKAFSEYRWDESSFHCGLAKVVKDGKYGYINKKGELVIPFIYQYADKFINNQARVMPLGTDEYIYIDTKGNKKASPSGLFLDSKYVDGKNLWGFVDPQGRTVVRHKFEEAKDFSEGLARVKLNGLYFFINNLEGVRTEHYSDAAEYVSDGFIRYKPRASSINGYSPKWGFLSRSSNYSSIPPKYSEAGDFSEGLAYVGEYSSLWFGFIDKNDNKVFETKYTVSPGALFKDGLIPVSDSSRKYAYMNRSGKLITPFKFDYAENFSEGLAVVSIGDKWGYIDKQGNTTFNPPTSTTNNNVQNVSQEVVDNVDVNASFVGGTEALVRWLNANLKYPKIALDNGIMGMVGVSFVVGADGSIGEVKLANPVDPSLDKEAIRLVKSMPKWNPATLNGKPVAHRLKITVPFKFELVEE